MDVYKDLIAENVAPKGARDIGVYKDGEKVGRIPLGSLEPPVGRPLYSFGLLADPHVGIAGAKEALCKAIERFKRLGVDFICIAGDLVEQGENESHWIEYDEAVKGAGDIPVHAIPGNHEMLSYVSLGIEANVREHTGYGYDGVGDDGVCRSFEHDGDVFILLGAWLQFQGDSGAFLAYENENDVNRIKQKFRENRNKRCFVIQHPEPIDRTHADYATLPLSMYQHHKNISVFHGHRHDKFELQTERNKDTNYKNDGFRSVHIASCGYHGQGYIVDVYENGYHLRGMDLVADKDIPLANYWIDTALVEVDEY